MALARLSHILFQLFLHGKNHKELHKYIQPAYLPPEFGGTLAAEQKDPKVWYPVLKELDPYFEGNYHL